MNTFTHVASLSDARHKREAMSALDDHRHSLQDLLARGGHIAEIVRELQHNPLADLATTTGDTVYESVEGKIVALEQSADSEPDISHRSLPSHTIDTLAVTSIARSKLDHRTVNTKDTSLDHIATVTDLAVRRTTQ